MEPKRGLGGAQAYRKNSQKHDFSKSDSEKILFRKLYVGREAVGSKEPPGGIIYFWTVLSPNGALRARPKLIMCPWPQPPTQKYKNPADSLSWREEGPLRQAIETPFLAPGFQSI